MIASPDIDLKYVDIFLEPIRVCASYKPKFGGDGEDGSPATVADFKSLFGADPLYHWLGLDSELMYAAHKAAGGMTSIYRQIGIACERLFRAIVRDGLALSEEQVAWSYEVESQPGKKQRLTLDARIDMGHLRGVAKVRLIEWVLRCAASMRVPENRAKELRGAVFEVRQGYKSADSKRQNADLRFGIRSYNENYLPVILVVSTQVSQTVVSRYRASNLLVLTGTLARDDTVSTYAFCENVVGYSLSDFFERNKAKIRREMNAVLKALLSPDAM